MRKFTFIAFSAAVCCFGQETIVTNLEDSLDTKVAVTNAAEISELNRRSAQADARRLLKTKTRGLSPQTPKVRRVAMARRVSVDGEIKKGVYVSAGKGRARRGGRAKVDSSGDLLLTDLTKASIPVETREAFGRGARRAARRISVTNDNERRVFAVDASKYGVYGTGDAAKELAKMKIVSDFETPFDSTFVDQARLNDLKALPEDMYLEWIWTLSAHRTNDIRFIKAERRKIAGEAWISAELGYDAIVKNRAAANLKRLKAFGYDAVLVRFDCSEDAGCLFRMIDDIKAEGFGVFAAYTGLDNQQPEWNPFIKPAKIEEYVRAVAPKCDGFFLNWRQTSNHVRLLPAEYFNWMCAILRRANPEIAVYGEIYYGRIDAIGENTLAYTAPKNVTGVVICNVGFYGNNIAYTVN